MKPLPCGPSGMWGPKIADGYGDFLLLSFPLALISSVGTGGCNAPRTLAAGSTGGTLGGAAGSVIGPGWPIVNDKPINKIGNMRRLPWQIGEVTLLCPREGSSPAFRPAIRLGGLWIHRHSSQPAWW